MGFGSLLKKAAGGMAGGLAKGAAGAAGALGGGKGPVAMDGPGTGGITGMGPDRPKFGGIMGGGLAGIIGKMRGRGGGAPKPPMAPPMKKRGPITGKGMSNIRTLGRR